MKMSSSSSQNEFSHRQGSIMSLPDEEDQTTIASDRFPTQQHRSDANDYSRASNLEDVQTASIDLQTVPDTSTDENPTSEEESREIVNNDQKYRSQSRSDSTDDLTTSFGFQQQTDSIVHISKEDNTSFDYESIIQSQKLYYDPHPELIRKPQMIAPLLYTQKVMVKFLKPPSIPLGPLIIREVRPPQPPPPPPLVIRQRPPPPLSPPPLVLREKPPKVPAILTTQVVTKTLPPLPPPPRSVIIEKLPALPTKPRDIVIERWIPYEATAYKRKVVIQRAEQPKPQPPPRNVIITYDKVEAKVIRQFQNQGISLENPENYSTRYGDSLLDTKDLLEKVKELGITEDISTPSLIDRELEQQFKSNIIESKKSPNGYHSFDKISFNGHDHHHYAPTYENLIQGTPSSSSSSINYDDSNENLLNPENFSDDISTQLAQYGLTTESLPY